MAKGNRGGSRGTYGYQVQKEINVADRDLKEAQKRFDYEVSRYTDKGTSVSVAKKLVTKNFNAGGIETPQKIKLRLDKLKKLQKKTYYTSGQLSFKI